MKKPPSTLACEIGSTGASALTLGLVAVFGLAIGWRWGFAMPAWVRWSGLIALPLAPWALWVNGCDLYRWYFWKCQTHRGRFDRM